MSIVSDSVLASRAGGRVGPGYGGFYEDYRDQMIGSPSRALFDAAAAPSLRWEGLVKRFGAVQDVVSYQLVHGRIRVEFDRNSHLPTAVEIVRHPVMEIRRAMFGDVTTRIEYVDWNAQPNGL